MRELPIGWKADPKALINEMESIDVSEKGTFQTQICSCGISGCASGNMVTLRRLGDWVVWLPLISRLIDEPLNKDFSPPDFFKESGIPFFTKEMHASVPKFPAWEKVSPVRNREWAYTLQLIAPYQILGKLPAAPKLSEDLSLTSGTPEAINSLLAKAMNDNSPAKFESGNETEILLDAPEAISWRAFATVGNEARYLSPTKFGTRAPDDGARKTRPHQS